MTNPQHQLSEGEIDSLMNSGSTETQIDLAKKLADKYNGDSSHGLKSSDVETANNLFAALLKSAEVQVRSVLSASLSHNDKLPMDLLHMMAKDVSAVSGPILEHSTLLTDIDLIQMISEEADAAKLEAIARRKVVSEAVSGALVETQIESVVKTVVQNEGAAISEQTFFKIAERHTDSAELMESLLQRSAVPIPVMEKVIERVSATMRAQLEKKYGNLDEFKEMKNTLEQSLELTSIKMLGFESTDQELMQLLNRLDGSNKLTPFSAISTANLKLFEISMSRLLNVPLKNMQILLQDAGGFRRTYFLAELPEFLFEAAQLAISSIRELETQRLQEGRPPITPHQLMQHMRVAAGDREIDGIDYLYALMRQPPRRASTGF